MLLFGSNIKSMQKWKLMHVIPDIIIITQVGDSEET